MPSKFLNRLNPAMSGFAGLTIPVSSASFPGVAAGTDFEIPFFYVPPFISDASNGNDVLEYGRTVFYTVKAVYVLPDAAMTGATATATTLFVKRYDAAGANGVTVATFAFITGQNLVAFAGFALTLSATLANLNLVAGSMLTLGKTHATTGTATPNLGVSVDLV
jgi:hypothetical protein